MASSRKSVHDTHISKQIRSLHESLIEIVSVMNRPQNDEKMVRKAGIQLDKALFPLLVGIERLGPIGVVDLSERAGRDYSTVSRQVSKLESLGLIVREEGSKDKRIHQATITTKGRTMIVQIDIAREKMGRALFKDWEEKEVDDLVRLMRKFSEALKIRE